MEPKVVNRAIVSAAHSASDWCYPPNSSFSQQSGSGNNWARGYNSYGPKFASTVCELVRREVKLALSGAEAGTAAMHDAQVLCCHQAAHICRLSKLITLEVSSCFRAWQVAQEQVWGHTWQKLSGTHSHQLS